MRLLIITFILLFFNSCVKEKGEILLGEPPSIQQMLDNGHTPYDLINKFNTPFDSFILKKYKGGIIILFGKRFGERLIVYPYNLTTKHHFGCKNLNTYRKVFDGFGLGESNTNFLIKNCAEKNIGAKVCKNLGNKWFLPSIFELDAIANSVSNTQILPPGEYLSSSDSGTPNDILKILPNGNISKNYGNKNNLYLVRPVKYF